MKQYLLLLICFIYCQLSYAQEKDSTIYSIVEQMPRFPGCEDFEGDERSKQNCADQKLLTYLYNNLRTPSNRIIPDWASRVLISFVIEEEGNVILAKIIKPRDPVMDAHVLALIKKMPPWIAGKHKGQKVKVRYALPIRINFR